MFTHLLVIAVSEVFPGDLGSDPRPWVSLHAGNWEQEANAARMTEDATEHAAIRAKGSDDTSYREGGRRLPGALLSVTRIVTPFARLLRNGLLL